MEQDYREGIGRGRVILVTGAGGGLGAAFARGWAALGARVIVNNRCHPGRPASAARLAADICAAGGEAVADLHDVTDPKAADAMVGTAISAFGRLDAIILNAGTSGPAVKVAGLAADDLRAVMEANFFANVAIVQAALPHLAASGSGRILFISSSAGLYGVKGRAAYAASKGALNAFALSLAREVRRDGIFVNLLAPYAATKMTAQGLPPDVAAAMAVDHLVPLAIAMTAADFAETGQIRVAGGGVERFARVVEGADSNLQDARGFADAETAFADLLAAVQAEAQAA